MVTNESQKRHDKTEILEETTNNEYWKIAKTDIRVGKGNGKWKRLDRLHKKTIIWTMLEGIMGKPTNHRNKKGMGWNDRGEDTHKKKTTHGWEEQAANRNWEHK